MGTIYRETASHGIRNGKTRYETRWVAEIQVDGVRRRKRATRYVDALRWLNDREAERRKPAMPSTKTGCPVSKNRTDAAVKSYLYRLHQRLKKGELVEVDGASHYLIDRKTLRCYSLFNASQVSNVGSRENPVYQMTADDGQRISVSASRVVWAAEHGVPLSKIPSDYTFIRQADGTIHADKILNYANRQRLAMRALGRLEFLDRKIHELRLLRECYATGDNTEAMQYIMRHREDICRMFIRRTKATRPVADELLMAASIRIDDNMQRPENVYTNITDNVVGVMQDIYSERKRERMYNDNFRPLLAP